MAELNVQPKSKSPWWIWLIVAIIVIGILAYSLSGDNENNTVPPNTDSDTTDVMGMDRTDPKWDNIVQMDQLFPNDNIMHKYILPIYEIV